MTKREALEKCMDQWRLIYNELRRMEVAAEDGEVYQVPTMNPLKRGALYEAGVSDDDFPLNACYMCEYVQTTYPTAYNEPMACEFCPLKGYAWEQCETDGPYIGCDNALDAECFVEASDCASEIIRACERALEDLEDDDEE